jgi:hypothetical protein
METALRQLVDKRAELKGEYTHYLEKIEELKHSIECLDGSIKIFDPDFKPDSIKEKKYKKSPSVFKPGESLRMSLDILRKASEPISIQEIRKEIVRQKKLDENDLTLQRTIEANIRVNIEKNELIKVHNELEKPKRWLIA